MNPDKMGTDPETLANAKEVVDALTDVGFKPDAVEFRRTGPSPKDGSAFAIHYDHNSEAFEEGPDGADGGE